MKIYFVNDEIIKCGGMITNYHYIRELRGRGFQAELVAQGKNTELAIFFGVTPLPMNVLGKNTDEDVIIANWWKQINTLSYYKGKKIQFIQGDDAYAYKNDPELTRTLLEARQRPEWHLISTSEFAGAYTGKECVVIPNGVGTQFEPDNCTEKWDIVVEGNDEPNKNIENTINEARKYSNNILWVGRNASDKYGTDFRQYEYEKMHKPYQRSKVLLKMSDKEGFCLPILEAMACGCLVATVDMGGNDFCTWGYNCIHPEQIGEYLKDDYKREQIVRAGSETAKQFTWKKATDKLLNYLTIKNSDIIKNT